MASHSAVKKTSTNNVYTVKHKKTINWYDHLTFIVALIAFLKAFNLM